MRHAPTWLAAPASAAAPALAVWGWDALENGSGRDGPAGLGFVLVVLLLAWLVAGAVLAALADRPRQAGWLCGALVAVVAVAAAVRVAANVEPDARFVVFVAVAPVAVVCLALGVACGLGVEAWRRRSASA